MGQLFATGEPPAVTGTGRCHHQSPRENLKDIPAINRDILPQAIPGYNVLTETADPGQDPQRGGLIVTHPGKGTYIYVAYALHLQTPELIPGAYRLLANLLSAGHDAARQK